MVGTSVWAANTGALAPDWHRPTIDPSCVEAPPTCDDGAPDNVSATAFGLKARIFKRIIDVAVGGAALIVTAPLVAAAADRDPVESDGPALFNAGGRVSTAGRSRCSSCAR